MKISVSLYYIHMSIKAFPETNSAGKIDIDAEGQTSQSRRQTNFTEINRLDVVGCRGFSLLKHTQI